MLNLPKKASQDEQIMQIPLSDWQLTIVDHDILLLEKKSLILRWGRDSAGIASAASELKIKGGLALSSVK